MHRDGLELIWRSGVGHSLGGFVGTRDRKWADMIPADLAASLLQSLGAGLSKAVTFF